MPSRRALLAGAAGLTAAGGLAETVHLGAVTAPEPPPDTWPQARYGPANTAGNPDVVVPDDPSIDWQTVELPQSYDTTVVVGPETVYLGGAGIAAFDRGSGTRQWQEAAPGHFLSLANGVLFGASRSTPPGFEPGTIGPVAIDVETGSLRWQADGQTRIYHLIAGRDALYVGDHGRFLAFDRQTGRQRWAVTRGYDAETYPMIHGGSLYGGLERLVRFESRSLLDLATVSGPSMRWETDYFDEMDPPAATDDIVVFGQYHHTIAAESRPGLIAFDAHSGERLWDAVTPRPDDDRLEVGSPAIAESEGFVGIRNGSDETQQYAVAGLDLRTGEVRWRTAVDQRVWHLAVGRDVVIVGTAAPRDSAREQKGSIRALDRSDGRERWHIPTESPVSSLALVDGTIFTSTVRGGLLALR